MPRFQLVVRGDGRWGSIATILHGLGFTIGAPGTGLTGVRPLPHANPLVDEGGSTGPAKVQLMSADARLTVDPPMPPLAFKGATAAPSGMKVVNAVGIAAIPTWWAGRPLPATNAWAIRLL